MKKLSVVGMVFVLAIAFGFGNAYAATAKASARCTGIAIADRVSIENADTEGFSPIFKTDIKTSEMKDLFVDVSLECGLTTDTTVISRQLAKALATAEASIEIKVLVDGDLAEPGIVTFAKRTQTLIAEFAGDISGAIVQDAETGIVSIDETLIESETLQLILDTMSANSFNFIAPDVEVGPHAVTVLARVTYSTNSEVTDLSGAAAAATAYLGKGSVTVESVRMVKDEAVEM